MAADSDEIDSKTTPRPEAIDDNQHWWLRFVPKSKEWSDVNISRFLSIYKAHSILWDPTHSFYTDEPKRMKAYNIIVKKLNLYGVRERECIELIESLKSLYAEEKKRQMIATRCSQKYSPPPSWYSMLEGIMLECVQRKLRESAKRGSVQAEPAKPWEVCCPRLYNEDIWTPKHFRTNVIDWFLTPQDEQLLCTCKESSVTKFEDVCSTETSSTYYRDSGSDSSSGIIQCGDQRSSRSLDSCCGSAHGSVKLPKRCGENVNNDETRTACDDQNGTERERISSFCKGETTFSVNKVRCPLKNIKECNNRVVARTEENNTSNTEGGECKIQKGQTRKKNRISSEDTKKIISCGKDVDLPKDSGSVLCRMDDISVCEDTSRTESLPCGCEREADRRLPRHTTTCRSHPSKESLKPCGIRAVRPCGPKKVPKFCTNKKRGSATTSSNSRASSSSNSHDTCCSLSDSNTTSVTTSASSNRTRKSLRLERTLIPEREESDHRLDDLLDPTLCEKCAVDRVSVRGAYENVVQSEDPRMPELDKYCRYKDWDAIYNIRSQVPDDGPATIQKDENWLTMRCTDEPPRPMRHNHSPTEADINLFIDPKSSEAKEVSLNNKYKWEYGLNIQIDQRRHYACEVIQIPGDKPAQLIL